MEVLIALIVLVLLDLAAMRWGVDSRESEGYAEQLRRQKLEGVNA